MPPLHVPMLEKYGTRVPRTIEEVKAWYRKIALSVHPDKGGTKEEFQDLENEYAQCKVYFNVHIHQDQSTIEEDSFDSFRRELIKRMERVERERATLAHELNEVRKNCSIFRKSLRCSW